MYIGRPGEQVEVFTITGMTANEFFQVACAHDLAVEAKKRSKAGGKKKEEGNTTSTSGKSPSK